MHRHTTLSVVFCIIWFFLRKKDKIKSIWKSPSPSCFYFCMKNFFSKSRWSWDEERKKFQPWRLNNERRKSANNQVAFSVGKLYKHWKILTCVLHIHLHKINASLFNPFQFIFTNTHALIVPMKSRRWSSGGLCLRWKLFTAENSMAEN